MNQFDCKEFIKKLYHIRHNAFSHGYALHDQIKNKRICQPMMREFKLNFDEVMTHRKFLHKHI